MSRVLSGLAEISERSGFRFGFVKAWALGDYEPQVLNSKLHGVGRGSGPGISCRKLGSLKCTATPTRIASAYELKLKL